MLRCQSAVDNGQRKFGANYMRVSAKINEVVGGIPYIRMPRAKQLTAHVDNRPGMLGEVGSALGAKKVNVLAFMASVDAGHATIRMIVDKPAAAKKIFAERYWETSEEDVLTVVLPDKPGSLGLVAHKLREASVNIDYAYLGSAGSARRVNAYFGVSDLKLAMRAVR
ncbi:MAG: amino acid-binding protein [Candidatus Dormibacter sp.]